MFKHEFTFGPGERVETIFGELGEVQACMIDVAGEFYNVVTRHRKEWFKPTQLKASDWKDGASEHVYWSDLHRDSEGGETKPNPQGVA